MDFFEVLLHHKLRKNAQLNIFPEYGAKISLLIASAKTSVVFICTILEILPGKHTCCESLVKTFELSITLYNCSQFVGGWLWYHKGLCRVS